MSNILIRGANFTGEKNGSRIWGLPYSYNHLTDLNNRVFNNTLFGDFAMLHLSPGKLTSSLGMVRSLKGFVNNFIPFIPEFDERPYLWSPDWYNYLSYFNTLVQSTMTMMYSMTGVDPFGMSNKLMFSYDYNNQFSLSSKDVYANNINRIENAEYQTQLKQSRYYAAVSQYKVKERDIENLEQIKAIALSDATKYKKDVSSVNEYYDKKKETMEEELKKLKENASKLNTDLNDEDVANYTQEQINLKFSELYKNIKNKRSKTTMNYGMTYFMEASSSISEDISNSFGSSSYEEEANSMAEEVRNKNITMERGGTIGAIKAFGESIITSLKEFISTRNDMDSTSVMDGASIVYPEVFKSSDYDKSYSISMKFYTPDGSPFSQLENVYMPLYSLMAMALARQGSKNMFNDSYSGSVNSYSSPFILRADAPGNFSSDTCIISNLSFKKEGGWTVSNQPIGLDVTLSIRDIYPMMIMSNSVEELNKNGTMLNYIANMAGIPLVDVDRFMFKLTNKYDLWRDRIGMLSPDNILLNAKTEGLGIMENVINKAIEFLGF